MRRHFIFAALAAIGFFGLAQLVFNHEADAGEYDVEIYFDSDGQPVPATEALKKAEWTNVRAAADECNRDADRSACEAAKKAANAPAYHGPKAPTTEPMVCLYALYDKPTELVLFEGEVLEERSFLLTRYVPHVVEILLRWRSSAITWKPWSRDPRLYVGEICIQKGLLPRSVVTLCNGTRLNEGNHSTWRAPHQRQLLSQGRIGPNDPACLLGEQECAKYGL